jgi:hypothetical protein
MFPLVCVSKTTAGPPKIGHLEFLKRIDYVIPYARGIWNGCIILTDVKTIIDTSTEMFREMPVDMLTDDHRWITGVNGDPVYLC